MNKARRKQLEKASALLSEAREIIESCRDEEQDAFDNMPEGLQQSERWRNTSIRWMRLQAALRTQSPVLMTSSADDRHMHRDKRKGRYGVLFFDHMF